MSYRLQVQPFAFDGGGGGRFMRPGFRRQFLALHQAERGQLAFDDALGAPGKRDFGRNTVAVVGHVRPARLLPDQVLEFHGRAGTGYESIIAANRLTT